MKRFDPDGDPTREELFWTVNGQELISEKKVEICDVKKCQKKGTR